MTSMDEIVDAAKLLASREQWRPLLDADFYPRMLVSRDGRVVMVNDLALELLDYPESMVLGHLVEEFIPEELRIRHVGFRTMYFDRPTRRAMGTGMELQVLTRYGKAIKVDIGLAPLRIEEGTLVSITFR